MLHPWGCSSSLGKRRAVCCVPAALPRLCMGVCLVLGFWKPKVTSYGVTLSLLCLGEEMKGSESIPKGFESIPKGFFLALR